MRTLSCFEISWVFFSKAPKLLFIQQTTFPPENNSKSSPLIFRYIWYRQNFAHILNYLLSPNSFFRISSSSVKPHTPLQEWGNLQNICLPQWQRFSKACAASSNLWWRAQLLLLPGGLAVWTVGEAIMEIRPERVATQSIESEPLPVYYSLKRY